jgi:TldD protein
MRTPDQVRGSLQAVFQRLKSQGAEYADARWETHRTERVLVRNGEVAALTQHEEAGFGIRVLHKGAWGFAASPFVTEQEIEHIAKRALEIAKASALTVKEPVRLDDWEPQRGQYESPCEVDPFTVPLDEKLELLMRADEILRKAPEIKNAESALRFHAAEKFFTSSDGAEITQHITESGGGLEVRAVRDGEAQQRSYPAAHGGESAARGWEFIASLKLVENAERVREEALQLLKADPCPSGEFDIILDSNQLALQIHESCGHPTELDRALGMELSFAGGSFLTPDQLGKLRYGSEKVTIIADATIPGALGSFGYDDEGVPAQRWPIIEEGLFVGYLSSRDTAPKIHQRSTGACRAESWNRVPIVRMVNISLEADPDGPSLEELISDTKQGLFLSTNKAWSIDDRRLNFQFGCEIAWEIKGGRLGRIVKNPVYTGITPEFWNRCDAVCNASEWRMWGLTNCGKGEPMQVMHVGHGAAPARFRGVTVGGSR